MAELCDVFHRTASYVHTWLGHQPAVKEESITDWLLYDISQNAAEVTYLAFTRHEEARTTGADWEWWILFHDGAIRLRVQAKRLFDDKDNYPGLAHTNRHGLQITKLLADSAAVNALPFYAFYSTGQSGFWCPASPRAPEGVHFASAFRVERAFLQERAFVASNHAMRIANPISCLFCCPMSKGRASNFLGHLARYHELPLEEPKASTGFHKVLPSFVLRLMRAEGQESASRGFEVPRELDNVGALFIVDLRD